MKIMQLLAGVLFASLFLAELGHAAKLAQDRVSPNMDGKSYLMHQHCVGEGVGRHVQMMRGSVDAAVRHNLTLVCNPEDFDGSEHGIGNIGFLFGCVSRKSVTGQLASLDEVSGLNSGRNISWQLVDLVDVNKPKVHLTSPIKPKHLYIVRRNKTCTWKFNKDGHGSPNKDVVSNDAWGEGWRWFKSQYSLVFSQSKARQRNSCWANVSPGKKRIALHLRRGDDEFHWRAFTADTYADILRRVFRGEIPGVPAMSEQDVAVQVIAETTLDREPQLEGIQKKFKKAQVFFRLGDPTKSKQAAKDRVISDLDCVHGSDLLLSSSGTFSELLSVIQKDGGKTICMNSGFAGLPSVVADPMEASHRLLRKNMLKNVPVAMVSHSSITYKQGKLPAITDVIMGQVMPGN